MIIPEPKHLPLQLVPGTHMEFPEECKIVSKHPTPDTTLAYVLLTQGPHLTLEIMTMKVKDKTDLGKVLGLSCCALSTASFGG